MWDTTFTAIVNMRASGAVWDVDVSRGGRWGNPYKIGADGSREEVIEKYRLWLWAQVKRGEILPRDLAGLYERRLGCWCVPKKCHASVLVSAAAWAVKLLEDNRRDGLV